jgi:hypothetical protein
MEVQVKERIGCNLPPLRLVQPAMNAKIILVLSLATASFVSAARAEPNLDITAEIRLGRSLPPPPPEVIVVEQVGPPGPPPWARTRWYRRNHAYYYYPGCDVYYRPADRVWFYLDGGGWRIGAQLPVTVRVDFGRAVSLSLEGDRPYVYHERVATYYPSNYFTKVKFKHDPDNWADRHGDRRDHDAPGGSDRGKGPKKYRRK